MASSDTIKSSITNRWKSVRIHGVKNATICDIYAIYEIYRGHITHHVPSTAIEERLWATFGFWFVAVLPGISAIDPRSCRHASPLSAIISSGRMPLSASVTSRRIIATGESGQSNWHNCPARKIDRAYRWEGVNAKKGPRFYHQIIRIYQTTPNTRGKHVSYASSVSCPWNSVFDFVKIDAPVLNNLSGFRRRSYATFTCCLRCNPPYEIVHSNVYTYAALGNDQLLLKHGNAVFIANKGPIMRVYTPFSLWK